MESARVRFEVILHLAKRDFVLRYKRSLMGVLWSLLVPLAQLVVLVVLFQVLVPLEIEAYPAFLFTGLLPWTWFSTCLASSGRLFSANRDLMFQPDFEPATLVIVNTLSGLLVYLAALPILVLLLLAFQRPLTPALLWVPWFLFIQAVLISGLSLIVATLNVFFRDVEYSVGILLMLLFYMTPVFYDPQTLSEGFRALFALNPVAGLLENYRALFFYGAWPRWHSLVWLTLVSSGVWVAGCKVYRDQLADVMDEI